MQILATDVKKMIGFLRAAKNGRNAVSNVILSTDPGKEKPWNRAEWPRIGKVTFFDTNGKMVVSDSLEAVLACVNTAYGKYVWVAEGHEHLLQDPRWENVQRIRAIDYAY